uniref:PH domain-containing protein n=1 Tax=Globisporangium ultimum (strain ATCC 200006 / CBS 805.95 / DAOM BR144) TaxID=431595 RepID=K3X7A2_GLOUD
MKTPRNDRGPVPISGYLFKMKSTERLLASQWNKRFFALEGKELKYYTHESSTEASKVIDLLSIESIRRFENGDHGVFSFVLKTPDRSYFLRAESKGDMKRWVRGLKDQQDLWRVKEKGSVLPDPAARKPKHYSDVPIGTFVSQRSSTNLQVK